MKTSSLPDKVSIEFSNCKLLEYMTNSGSLTRIQTSVTYLALDCFHPIGIEALLTFATELLEVHLKKASSQLL